MTIMDRLSEMARRSPRRVVLPDGEDERILKAARTIRDEGIAHPILLGRKGEICDTAERGSIDLEGMEVDDPSTSERLEGYCERYTELRGIPGGAAGRILSRPCYFAAMMLRTGEADGMVAGAITPTEDIIMAADVLIGTEEGVDTPSSFFLMEVPGYDGGEEGRLLFADAAGNPDPGPEQLADIAMATARSARRLFDWEPRVAMLSFSTKGSASHPSIDRVLRAVDIVREREPGIPIDGELQADAALVMEVAERKLGDRGEVAGRANILIFPDLNSGNISYKLVQRLAGAKAYGPIMQGYSRPISDLSRGATVDDIVGAIIVVAAQASGV